MVDERLWFQMNNQSNALMATFLMKYPIIIGKLECVEMVIHSNPSRNGKLTSYNSWRSLSTEMLEELTIRERLIRLFIQYAWCNEECSKRTLFRTLHHVSSF